MLSGSCHCQRVRYEVTGPIQHAQHCHCHTCRKIHGTAFGSSAVVDETVFRVVEGQDHLAEYESSPAKRRYFCKTCHSPIYALQADDPGIVVLRLGTLDDEPDQKPSRHIWIGDKPAWYDVGDTLPQHETT